jgi:hypothetical protein
MMADSVDEIAWRCRRQRKTPIEGRGARQKNRQFLAQSAGVWYCSSEIDASQTCLFGGADWRALAVARGNDSEMAPQIIEIARNGLGMVIRQLRCPSEGVSIKRTV